MSKRLKLAEPRDSLKRLFSVLISAFDHGVFFEACFLLDRKIRFDLMTPFPKLNYFMTLTPESRQDIVSEICELIDRQPPFDPDPDV